MRTLLVLLTLAFPLVASAQFTQGAPGGATIVQQPTITDRIQEVTGLRHSATRTGQVSGTSLGLKTEVVAPDGGWVYGVQLAERADRPCYINLFWATINNGEIQTAASGFNYCNGTRQSTRSISYNVGPLANGEFHSESLAAVTGIKVCQRDRNDRLKGLETEGRYLGPGRAFMSLTGNAPTRTIERTNCNDWEARPVRCTGGKVLVGLEVQHVTRRGQDIIKGLAPICSNLRIER